MICQTCRTAADRGLHPSAHCDATGGPGARCDCQHRPPARPAGCTATIRLADHGIVRRCCQPAGHHGPDGELLHRSVVSPAGVAHAWHDEDDRATPHRADAGTTKEDWL